MHLHSLEGKLLQTVPYSKMDKFKFIQPRELMMSRRAPVVRFKLEVQKQGDGPKIELLISKNREKMEKDRERAMLLKARPDGGLG